MFETKLIQYNLKDRGRKYRGQDRKFNIPALVKAINGGDCQERVKNRDMLGYYGHWARMRFGMMPPEGGLDKGKPASAEPALVTTYLKAHPDGTIEHKAEFLDTDAGKLAAKLFQSRVGGFSSAIDAQKPEFFGFDYVNEPNYNTNRGWTFDSVSGFTLDDIDSAIYAEELAGISALFDAVCGQIDAANKTIESLRQENEDLINELIKRGGKLNPAQLENVQPLFVAKAPAERVIQDSAEFRNMRELPTVRVPDDNAPMDPVAHRLLKQYLR